MNFNDFDWDMDDDLDLQPGTEGWDTEEEQKVTFVAWADEDHQMVIVEGANLEQYGTYPEEIDWTRTC